VSKTDPLRDEQKLDCYLIDPANLQTCLDVKNDSEAEITNCKTANSAAKAACEATKIKIISNAKKLECAGR
jgi:hypothetical protein